MLLGTGGPLFTENPNISASVCLNQSVRSMSSVTEVDPTSAIWESSRIRMDFLEGKKKGVIKLKQINLDALPINEVSRKCGRY